MRLIQISAWNDSGGGFTHRLFDGHPQLRTWPFEMLLGQDRRDVDRFGDDWFRGRFRWPRLGPALSKADGAALFDRLSDSELKGVLRDPEGAKHRAFPIAVELEAWRRETARLWAADSRTSQAAFIEAYVEIFFALLGDGARDRPVLSHCPVAILDAPEVWADFPDARFLCVVRSPLAGYADMSRRHPALDPAGYAAKWSLVNAASVLWAGKAPDRVRIVHLDRLIDNRLLTMRSLCSWLGLEFNEIVLQPSWRGQPLDQAAMGPFGGVPAVSAEHERHLAQNLEPSVQETINRGTAAVAALLDAAAEGAS